MRRHDEEGTTGSQAQLAAVEGLLKQERLNRRVRERLEMVKAQVLGQDVAQISRWCGRTEATVTRVAPCLFGLFSVVALWYERLRSRGHATAEVSWAGKSEPTFSDAITTVRRWLWVNWVFANHGQGDAFSKLPRPLRETVLSALAHAA